LGEVIKEGTVTFGNNRVTLMEAIGTAGLTDIADRTYIKVIRQKGQKRKSSMSTFLEENS